MNVVEIGTQDPLQYHQFHQIAHEEHDRIKSEGKARRKKEGIQKGKKTRAENKRIKDSIYNSLSIEEKMFLEQEKAEIRLQKKIEKQMMELYKQ